MCIRDRSIAGKSVQNEGGQMHDTKSILDALGFEVEEVTLDLIYGCCDLENRLILIDLRLDEVMKQKLLSAFYQELIK
jgi:hypothetical protein